MTAKEIDYKNEFFQSAKSFYRDVLRISDIDGNGYFTAMIGLFFAEYKFGKNENISFIELLSYISNKSRQYVEYLSIRGKKEKVFVDEALLRLNQQPKMLPIREKVRFNDKKHSYLLLKKKIEKDTIWPVGNFFSISSGVALSIAVPETYTSTYFKVGQFVPVFINYNINMDWGILGFGIVTGFNNTDASKNIVYPYNMKTIPLGLDIRYYTKMTIPIFFMLDMNFGFTFNRIAYTEEVPHLKDHTVTTSYLSAMFDIGYLITKNVSLNLYFMYMAVFFSDHNYTAMGPGISIIFNF